jgi:hypothetical protein
VTIDLLTLFPAMAQGVFLQARDGGDVVQLGG